MTYTRLLSLVVQKIFFIGEDLFTIFTFKMCIFLFDIFLLGREFTTITTTLHTLNREEKVTFYKTTTSTANAETTTSTSGTTAISSTRTIKEDNNKTTKTTTKTKQQKHH